jgi:cell division protein FtsB
MSASYRQQIAVAAADPDGNRDGDRTYGPHPNPWFPLVLSILFWYFRAGMRIGVAFGICVILFTIVGGDHGLPALFQARRQSAALTAEIGRLREANARLRARASALRSDPSTIERIARETLGLSRADELIVRTSGRSTTGR